MQFCMPTMHHQALETNILCWSLQSFPEFSLSPYGNLSLPIYLRMISQTHDVFDSISAYEFLKHLVFKMASSITNNSSGCPKSAQNISL